MAIGVQMDFGGATLAQYDQITERIGLLPLGPAPDAELFHWVTKTDGGIRVVDVWESRDDFERFVEDKLSPVFEELGMSGPEIQFFDVHNYFSGGRWGR